MDRQRMERCLEQVAAYRASGLKGNAWAQAHSVPLRALSSGYAHAQRWQTRLDGVSASAPAPRAVGLRAGAVLRTASHSRQVRLRVLPDGPGRADTGADDRQGHPGPRPAGTGRGG